MTVGHDQLLSKNPLEFKTFAIVIFLAITLKVLSNLQKTITIEKKFLLGVEFSEDRGHHIFLVGKRTSSWHTVLKNQSLPACLVTFNCVT